MKFEEEFPNLKGKKSRAMIRSKDNEPEIVIVEHQDVYDDYQPVYTEEDIKENCLDKQRVKELIDFYAKRFDDDIYKHFKGTFKIFGNTIKQGLDLE